MTKVVLITGGSSGIGKSVGEYLLEKGYKVYGTSRTPENYPETLFPIIKLDVTQSNSISDCIDTLMQKETQLDVLVNNAGAGITGPLEEIPTSEIKKNFETNFFGPLEVIKKVLPIMRNQKSGLIINVTSIAGYMGLPYRGVYSASKGALEIMTEAISMEVKTFNIDIVNVAPGDFATNIAAGRYHSPLLPDSPYKQTYAKTLETMDAHVDDGNDPLEMARAIFKIINANNPKIHYKVGAFLQKFSIVLKRILPDRLYEKLLMNHYKL